MPALQNDPPPVETPADELKDPGVSAAEEPTATPWEQAGEWITKAEDETQTLADRIAAYEAALELLNALKSQPPVEGLPEGFDDTLAQTVRALEQLRLREYFP